MSDKITFGFGMQKIGSILTILLDRIAANDNLPIDELEAIGKAVGGELGDFSKQK